MICIVYKILYHETQVYYTAVNMPFCWLTYHWLDLLYRIHYIVLWNPYSLRRRTYINFLLNDVILSKWFVVRLTLTWWFVSCTKICVTETKYTPQMVFFLLVDIILTKCLYCIPKMLWNPNLLYRCAKISLLLDLTLTNDLYRVQNIVLNINPLYK